MCMVSTTSQINKFIEFVAVLGDLVILKAFTKLYGMAGVRLGYCLCGDETLLEKMQTAAEAFVGEHDFKSFCSIRTQVEDTVRRIYSITIKKNEDDRIDIRISGNGFLYNMVRIIVGTLVDVGYGRISPEDMPDIISSRNRSRAGFTAPPDGLYLRHVEFSR